MGKNFTIIEGQGFSRRFGYPVLVAKNDNRLPGIKKIVEKIVFFALSPYKFTYFMALEGFFEFLQVYLGSLHFCILKGLFWVLDIP